VPRRVAATNPNQDEILLTMTTANPGGLPTATIITPSSGSLIEIPNYAASDSTATIPVDRRPAPRTGPSITKVELYINGLLYATDTAYSDGGYPFTVDAYRPRDPMRSAGPGLRLQWERRAVTCHFTSTSTHAGGGPGKRSSIEAAPAIAITNPGGGATISSGGATIQAVAIDTNLDTSGNPDPDHAGAVLPGRSLRRLREHPDLGRPLPSQLQADPEHQNGVVVESLLTAMATDADGFQGTSPTVNVNVTSGGSATNNVVIGTPSHGVAHGPRKPGSTSPSTSPDHAFRHR
jgi:hypothetical protein